MSITDNNDGIDLRKKVRAFYAPDDYENINALYFSEILRKKSWKALPAGWHNPYSLAAERFVLQPSTFEDSIRYALDEDHSLGDLKFLILEILSSWEKRHISWNEATICPSVSTANLVVLAALKARGVQSIIFEAPAYYATLMQAEMLNFEINRVAGSLEQNFDTHIDDIKLLLPSSPCVLWMTQPRFGVGCNQSKERIRKIAELLRPTDVLVFDEAAEQSFPSELSDLGEVGCDIIRTRGLLKGLGLNGLRTAVILHPPKWRAEMEMQLEPAGASLDRFSLKNFAALAETPNLLPALLATANRQVVEFRRELDIITMGTWVKPTALVNGYVGSLILDLTKLPGNYSKKRKALLDYCQKQQMPVVLRASIGLPHDDAWEAVRINYFTSCENVKVSAKILIDGHEDLLSRRL